MLRVGSVRLSHILACNSRIEEDLIDQLFNSSEAAGPHVVLLARYGKRDRPVGVVPKVSQETLAEMVGTARSRVNFLEQIQASRFIEYKRERPLKTNSSLVASFSTIDIERAANKLLGSIRRMTSSIGDDRRLKVQTRF